MVSPGAAFGLIMAVTELPLPLANVVPPPGLAGQSLRSLAFMLSFLCLGVGEWGYYYLVGLFFFFLTFYLP
jgi:choline-glycine betaine transporter